MINFAKVLGKYDNDIQFIKYEIYKNARNRKRLHIH